MADSPRVSHGRGPPSRCTRPRLTSRPPRRHRNTDASRRVTSTPPSTVRPIAPRTTDARTGGHVDHDSPRERLRRRPLCCHVAIYRYSLHYSLVAIRPRATTSPHGVRTSQHVLSRTPLPGQVAAVPPHAALACSTNAARPAPCSPRQRRDVTIVAPVGGDGYSRAGEFAIHIIRIIVSINNRDLLYPGPQHRAGISAHAAMGSRGPAVPEAPGGPKGASSGRVCHGYHGEPVRGRSTNGYGLDYGPT